MCLPGVDSFMLRFTVSCDRFIAVGGIASKRLYRLWDIVVLVHSKCLFHLTCVFQ